MPWDFSHYCKSVKDCEAGYLCVRFYWAHYDKRNLHQRYWPFYCRYFNENIEALESEENHDSSSQSSSDEYN